MQIIFNFTSNKDFIVHQLDKETLAVLEQEFNNLHQNNLEKKTPKQYPFNPNFISSYKGYELGMSLKQIERLHNFRANKKWINSAQDFQMVTGVSDALLTSISPYFKFPKWATQSQKKIRVHPKNNPN
jgi:hypothetical protein